MQEGIAGKCRNGPFWLHIKTRLSYGLQIYSDASLKKAPEANEIFADRPVCKHKKKKNICSGLNGGKMFYIYVTQEFFCLSCISHYFFYFNILHFVSICIPSRR